MNQVYKELYFRQILMEWLTSKEGELKHSSYMKYRNIVYNHLLPAFAYDKLDSLNPAYFKQFIARKMDDVNINNATVKLIYLVLKAAIVYANTNYHSDIQMDAFDIPLDCKQPSFLSTKHCQMIEEQCKKKITPLSIAVYISLYSGLRIGEVCALQVQDINFVKNIITVKKTIQRVQTPENLTNKTKLMIDTPKSTTSYRAVPIPSYLLHHILKPYVSECNPTHFLLTKTNKPTDPRNIQASFKRLCTTLDLQANFLSLRHTFATNCLKQGLELHALCQILGHSNVSVTSALYASTSNEDRLHQMQLINKLWNNNKEV